MSTSDTAPTSLQLISDLDMPELEKKRLLEVTDEANDFYRRGNESSLWALTHYTACGERLKAIRDGLPGCISFASWVEHSFDGSRQSAYRYIKLSDRQQDLQSLEKQHGPIESMRQAFKLLGEYAETEDAVTRVLQPDPTKPPKTRPEQPSSELDNRYGGDTRRFEYEFDQHNYGHEDHEENHTAPAPPPVDIQPRMDEVHGQDRHPPDQLESPRPAVGGTSQKKPRHQAEPTKPRRSEFDIIIENVTATLVSISLDINLNRLKEIKGTLTNLIEQLKPYSPSASPMAIDLPEWMHGEEWIEDGVHLWDAYVVLRGRDRKHCTAFAARMIISELAAARAEGHDPAAMLRKTIGSGWRGVFKPKPETNGTHSESTKNGTDAKGILERDYAGIKFFE